MNALFHRAKHWQLFSILYGGGIVFYFIAFLNISSHFARSIQLNQPPNLSGFFWFFIPLILLFVVITYGWQWSVAIGMKDKLPRGVNMNHRLFKGFMWVAALYPIVHSLFILLLFNSMHHAMATMDVFGLMKIWFSMMIGMVVMIPISLFALFCSFYGYYFCAKTLKSIELGYEAQLGDYIGYFFLFWFSFVGFWLIQPSLNKITSPNWIPPTPPPGYAPFDPDPTFTPPPPREVIPRGDLLKTRDHEAFEHDDDFEGLF